MTVISWDEYVASEDGVNIAGYGGRVLPVGVTDDGETDVVVIAFGFAGRIPDLTEEARQEIIAALRGKIKAS